jgi:hypothetical protein
MPGIGENGEPAPGSRSLTSGREESRGRALVQVRTGTAMVTIDTVIRMHNAIEIRDRLMKIRRLAGNAACTATSRLISLKYQRYLNKNLVNKTKFS